MMSIEVNAQSSQRGLMRLAKEIDQSAETTVYDLVKLMAEYAASKHPQLTEDQSAGLLGNVGWKAVSTSDDWAREQTEPELMNFKTDYTPPQGITNLRFLSRSRALIGRIRGTVDVRHAGRYVGRVICKLRGGNRNRPYAWYVEFGTKFMRAFPFMRPARELGARRAALIFWRRLQEALGRGPY